MNQNDNLYSCLFILMDTNKQPIKPVSFGSFVPGQEGCEAVSRWDEDLGVCGLCVRSNWATELEVSQKRGLRKISMDFREQMGFPGTVGNPQTSWWSFVFFGEWTLGMILERRLESWQTNCIIHHDTLPTIMAQWICFLGNWKWLPNCYDRFHFQQNWMQWLGSKSAQRYKRRGSLISRREKACPSRSRQGKEEKSLILHGGNLHLSNWITYASGSTTLIWCLSNRLSWIAVGICLDVGTLLGGVQPAGGGWSKAWYTKIIQN